MGAWGHKPLENDTALDFMADFDNAGPGAARMALSQAADMDADEYLDDDIGSPAVAAAFLVACAHDGDVAELQDATRVAIERNRDALKAGDMRRLSLRALARIMMDSETKELWDESPSADEWSSYMSDLVQRLETGQ